jgi:hypothetical protein
MQPLPKILFPTLGQGRDLQRPAHRASVVVGLALRDVEAGDFGDWQCRIFGNRRVSADQLEFIACADFAFSQDGEVKAGAAAGEEALDHVVHLETDAELVTGEARLGDDDLGRADGELVADVDGVLDCFSGR